MTQSFVSPSLVALGVQLTLGVLVFLANPRRESNQCFLLLSIAIGAWLATLHYGLSTTSVAIAEFCVRQASGAGVTILCILNLLRLSITKREGGWREIIGRSLFWLLGTAGIVCLCQTSLFLRSVSLPANTLTGITSLVPHYGSGIVIYIAYFLGATGLLFFNYLKALKQSTSTARAELSFILVGEAIGLGLLLIAFGVGFVIDRTRLIWIAPFRIVFFSLVIAYGIATRKIMEVGFFLRRAVSYALLVLYLASLYTFVWWLFTSALRPISSNAGSMGSFIAAIVVAFAMAPARGVSQTFADKLFVGTRGLDFRKTVSKATTILQSVTTLPELLRRFGTTITEALGPESLTVYLAARDELRPEYSLGDTSVQSGVTLARDEMLVRWLERDRQPVVLDELTRRRETLETVAIRERLQALNAAAAIGILSREQLIGVMVIGPRISGRIYGNVEQNALQVLCGQLAVAIQNAKLFTEVQNARIYNETLLQNLTTGVVAADADGQIIVFNHEAEEITGLSATSAVRGTVRELPGPLREVIENTLTSRERRENCEVTLRLASGSVFARASSSIFHGQDGQLLGALMVVTDITALKRLEQQIRRSDRLASLGTLSAGMAHEIKNPLVSIKTFSQLLPDRYDDSDFRETFSTLIVHEIDRIDSLVNQLLRFARPAKPLLQPMHVHEVLEKTILLVQHRLYQREIKLTRVWDADVDTIRADADQIEQVFLNFFLNAMDAMKNGGELTVRTSIVAADAVVSHLAGEDASDEILQICVCDTGEGIRFEDIPHVFDPFFTTKDYGTGLGLSVVHGIIQEHGGQIDVESELAKGTVFHIYLPLVRFKEEVAAA
ncbi:MAG: ATP-binding protein [Verrucomicrobiota bacterium]